MSACVSHDIEPRWREHLYVRISALGPVVRAIVGGRTTLGEHDVEDVWAELASRAVRSPESPGALKRGAEEWPEHCLREWLIEALHHRVIDLWRSRTDRRTGEQRLVCMDLVQAPVTGDDPSERVLASHRIDLWTRAITKQAGVDVARLLIMQAAGATAPEQRRALAVTDNQRRTLLNRAEFVARALREAGTPGAP